MINDREARQSMRKVGREWGGGYKPKYWMRFEQRLKGVKGTSLELPAGRTAERTAGYRPCPARSVEEDQGGRCGSGRGLRGQGE